MTLAKVKPPYASTTSEPEKTIADINKMLKRYGINDYQWTTLWDQKAIELKMIIEIIGHDGRPKKIGIKVTPPVFNAKRRTWDDKKGHYVSAELPNYAQAMRLLYHWLKVKIESVAYGLKEVEEEFLSDIMVRTPDGRETTVGKAMKLQLTDGVADMPRLGRGTEDNTPVQDVDWKPA